MGTGSLAPGTPGCPVNNQIPDWNDLVYRGGWRDALKGALEGIPPFDEIAGRQFNELTLPDIAAAMAMVEWIESHGPGALRLFHDELRKAAPPSPNRVLPNALLREACYEKAFQAAVKRSWKDADAAWRSWFRTR
jgi:hypothetical protein